MNLLTQGIIICGMLLIALANPGHYQTGITGKDLYARHCLTCHQANGSGVPGMYPPLIGTEKVLGPAPEMINIVFTGLKGPLEVKGVTYDQAMPPLGYLTDQEIAAILTFVRTSWGNKASVITAAAVKKVRPASAKIPAKK